MPTVRLNINGKEHVVENIDASTPLLWVLRDHLDLTGTKYGCGKSLCGTCTVHVGGNAVRSCTLPVTSVVGRPIKTIEGLAEPDGKLHPLQQAWIEHDVPQCGYCQAGQIMSAAALLEKNPKPTDADIDAAMAGNLCRCATYVRIRAAIHSAAAKLAAMHGGASVPAAAAAMAAADAVKGAHACACPSSSELSNPAAGAVQGGVA
jgi:aerobic-type carbon monoxide dehydrogenase small subunit (CoxS/CutS family)